MDLIEESCLASCRNEGKLALDKAKEASTKERTLIRQRDQAGLSEQHNMELTFVVSLHVFRAFGNGDGSCRLKPRSTARFQHGHLASVQ